MVVRNRTSIDVPLSRNEMHYIYLGLEVGLSECKKQHPKGIGSHHVYERLQKKIHRYQKEYMKRLKPKER